MSATFNHLSPHPALRSHVQTYWTAVFNAENQPNTTFTVTPNGSVELIFHLAEEHCYLPEGNQWNRTSQIVMIGLQPTSYMVRFDREVRVFGVRFHPDGVDSLLGLPPAILHDSYSCPEDLHRADYDLWHACFRKARTNDECRLLADQLLLQMTEKRQTERTFLTQAMSMIRKHQGLISQEELYKQVPLSPRQLQRQFKAKVGVTPKEYARIIRMSAAQQTLQTAHTNLRALTYGHGFSDQAHLTREFQRMIGTTPRAFLMDQERFIVNTAV